MAKYDIHFGTELPGGYVAESTKVKEPGGSVLVSLTGFSSTADGLMFVRRLEQLSNLVLSKLSDPSYARRPSQIDNMLVVISPDGTAQVPE